MTTRSTALRLNRTSALRLVALVALSATLTACGSAPKVEPATPAYAAHFELTKSSRGPVLTINDVLFDFEEATLHQNASGTMAKAADYLKKNPQRIAVVEGHTDHTGEQSYNQMLSEARSQSVKEALMSFGVAESRIKTNGLGETQPVASNDTLPGRQANRRVEVVFEKLNGI
ncbi:MAG: OmpA family protein [Granulosicoccaceae bacterium]